MTTADLLPCPLCNGPAAINRSDFGPPLVGCTPCHLHLWREKETEASAAWNTRAAADRAPEGRDAVLEEAAHVVLCATRVEGKYGGRERSIGELADLIRALKSSAKGTGT